VTEATKLYSRAGELQLVDSLLSTMKKLLERLPPAAEEAMKAALALLIIYVGAFLVAIQGSSPTSVEAAGQSAAGKNAAISVPAIDPAKEADIRALLELVGAHDQIQDSMTNSAEQYREKLLTSVNSSSNGKGQSFVNLVITGYEKKFDVDQVNEQLVAVYDKHYSADEIKGLLQFYGSPLGQKVAAEAPHIAREIQETTRAASAKAVKEALAEARQQDPQTGANAKLTPPAPRRFAQRRAAQQEGTQQAAQQDQP
jgi:hypothetical protein